MAVRGVVNLTDKTGGCHLYRVVGDERGRRYLARVANGRAKECVKRGGPMCDVFAEAQRRVFGHWRLVERCNANDGVFIVQTTEPIGEYVELTGDVLNFRNETL